MNLVKFILEMDNLGRVRVFLLTESDSVEMGFVSNLRNAMTIIEAQWMVEQKEGTNG